MLHPKLFRLLSAPNYVVLATLRGGTQPSAHMMWANCDDEFVYLNTEVKRVKFRDMVIGAKVAVLVFESSRSWAEIRGEVIEHVHGEAARSHLDQLSIRYNSHPYAKRIESPRVIVKVRPNHEYIYRPETAGDGWDR